MHRHRGLLLAPLALAGCAQLFGIDTTTGADAGNGVSLRVQRVSVGASVIKGPQDLTGQTADFLVGDATGIVRNTAVIAGPGTWTADIASGTPPALFTLPDLPMTAHHLWALPSRDMRGNLIAFEHPNSTPPGASSQLALNVTLPAPYTTETLMVFAVGAWMHHTLAGAEIPAAMATTVNPTIPYSSFVPVLSTITPARITASDVVLVLRYVGADLTGVLQATQFDQTDATDPVSGTMVAVAHDKMLDIPLPTDLAQRYAAVRPAVGAPSVSWNLSAAPGATVGIALGPQLLSGVPAMADTAVTAMFGDPFESLGWPATFNLNTSASRTAMINAIPVSLTAQMTTFVDASATAAPLDAGLPTTILVGTTQLNTDGQMLAIDTTKPVEISFLSDKSTNTLYQATIYELVLNGMAYDRQLVLDAVGTDPKFDIPSDLMTSGHTYVIRAGCIQGGFTMAASGDLESPSFPLSFGQLDSGVFTVQ